MELICPDEVNLKYHIPHIANEKTLNLNEIKKSFKRIVRDNLESKLYKPNRTTLLLQRAGQNIYQIKHPHLV
jgi:hypothetical protein